MVGRKKCCLIKQGIAGIWNDMNEPAVWGQAFPDIVQFDDHGYDANIKKFIMFMHWKWQGQHLTE